MGCVLSVVLSGSPLAVLRTVVSSRSTAAMPFTTSLITFLSNLSWLCYGALIGGTDRIFSYTNTILFLYTLSNYVLPRISTAILYILFYFCKYCSTYYNIHYF